MNDRLAEIRERWAATTPGPWAASENYAGQLDGQVWREPAEHEATFRDGVVTVSRERSAEHADKWGFDVVAIAAAPDDIAWLVERVEALEAESDALARTLRNVIARSERLQRVVEAAREWREDNWTGGTNAHMGLIAALESEPAND